MVKKAATNLPTYRGNLFTWGISECGERRVGLVDASDIGRDRGYCAVTDKGFAVRSHRTGVTKVFTLDHVMYAGEGCDREVNARVFSASDGSPVDVIVFND